MLSPKSFLIWVEIILRAGIRELIRCRGPSREYSGLAEDLACQSNLDLVVKSLSKFLLITPVSPGWLVSFPGCPN